MRAWCRLAVGTIEKRLGLDVPGDKAGTDPYLLLMMTSWRGLALGGEFRALLFGIAAKDTGREHRPIPNPRVRPSGVLLLSSLF